MPLLKAKALKALAHITGGGLPENLPRVLSKDLAVRIDVATSGWQLPPVFKWLKKAGNVPQVRTYTSHVQLIDVGILAC
jgi:phosphoribosylamine--glycine ligase / phosphoribosylformylglycinamidine cyclo-ligase